MLRERIVLIAFALVGWAICGAAVGLGRQVMSMEATLVVHALVAPLAFGLLAWSYSRWFPRASPTATALSMLFVVVALDAIVVAPFIERSYAMFQSVLGTWGPFALIFSASYAASRAAAKRAGHAQDGRGSAA